MPVGVKGGLHGLCLKKSHNIPPNLQLGVEFPSCGARKLGIRYVGFSLFKKQLDNRHNYRDLEFSFIFAILFLSFSDSSILQLN